MESERDYLFRRIPSSSSTVFSFPPNHLTDPQEMLESSSVDPPFGAPSSINPANHPLYYQPQPPPPPQQQQTYEASSPKNNRNISPISFRCRKHLVNLEPRRSLDTKVEYYPTTSEHATTCSPEERNSSIHPSSPFIRSSSNPGTQCDYYQSSMKSFPTTTIHSSESPGFMKPVEENDSESLAYQTTAPSSLEHTYQAGEYGMRSQIPLIPPQHLAKPTDYIEEGVGAGPRHAKNSQTALPLVNVPSATSMGVNNCRAMGPLGSPNNSSNLSSAISGATPNSAAIIYPWMKRVHSKGEFILMKYMT